MSGVMKLNELACTIIKTNGIEFVCVSVLTRIVSERVSESYVEYKIRENRRLKCK